MACTAMARENGAWSSVIGVKEHERHILVQIHMTRLRRKVGGRNASASTDDDVT